MTITPPPKQRCNHSQKQTQPSVPNMLNSNRTGALAAIATILAAGVALNANISFTTNSRQSAAVGQIQSTPGAYERIETDMALVEVQAILGPGIEISSSKTTEVYQWGNITGMFENGALIKKSRSSL